MKRRCLSRCARQPMDSGWRDPEQDARAGDATEDDEEASSSGTILRMLLSELWSGEETDDGEEEIAPIGEETPRMARLLALGA